MTKENLRREVQRHVEEFLRKGGVIKKYDQYGEWQDERREYTINFDKLERRRAVLGSEKRADSELLYSSDQGDARETRIHRIPVEDRQEEEPSAE